MVFEFIEKLWKPSLARWLFRVRFSRPKSKSYFGRSSGPKQTFDPPETYL